MFQNILKFALSNTKLAYLFMDVFEISYNFGLFSILNLKS